MKSGQEQSATCIQDLHPKGLLWGVKYAGFIGLRTLQATVFDRTPMREMSRFHGIGIITMEGFMRPKQYKWFAQLFAENDFKTVAEVGFNGGHSAFTFAQLGAQQVTSFDIGEHDYVLPTAAYLRTRFPKTDFELILGDSQKTIPQHDTAAPYNAVFIDGGHTLEAASSDILSLRNLSVPGGLVVMDDYTDKYAWRTGPKVAYDRAVSDGIIEPIDVAAGDHRVWALGKYT